MQWKIWNNYLLQWIYRCNNIKAGVFVVLFDSEHYYNTRKAYISISSKREKRIFISILSKREKCTILLVSVGDKDLSFCVGFKAPFANNNASEEEKVLGKAS